MTRLDIISKEVVFIGGGWGSVGAPAIVSVDKMKQHTVAEPLHEQTKRVRHLPWHLVDNQASAVGELHQQSTVNRNQIVKQIVKQIDADGRPNERKSFEQVYL